MNRPLSVIVGVISFVGLCIVIFSVVFLFNVSDANPGTPQILDTLSESQRQAYFTQQFQILNARQAGELKAAQQSFTWSFIWRVTGVICTFSMIGCTIMFVVFKNHHYAVTTVSEPDGRTVTTRIPVIDATKEERYLYASSQVVRNLALAQGDVNEQTQHMIRVIGQTVKDMSTVIPRQSSKMLPSLSNNDETLALPNGGITHTPPLATLIDDGTLGPGKPLIFGFSQGEPQYSLLTALKTLAVTGWQGSGKTLSVAYLVATALLSYAGNIKCIILDPHFRHPESLSAYLNPLKERGLIDVPNLFNWAKIWSGLNGHLDRRLNGQEPSTPHMLIVADEMGNLVRRDAEQGGVMVNFLDRATEETRKTEITFVGISHKWTARHFKGHADIRRCMNSLLIHRTKPSNAEMLLEDMGKSVKSQLKKIVQPGEGLFVRDYGEPVHVRMPFTRIDDIQRIGDIVSNFTPDDTLTIPCKEMLPSCTQPLDPKEIQTRIRGMLSSGLRLRDVWQQVFVLPSDGHPMMTEQTFLTKFKDPEKRPWTDKELELMSGFVVENG